MEIRLARETELSELPRIELSAAQAFAGSGMPAFLLTDFAPADAYLLHLAGGTLWVAETDGALVAFLAARVEGERLHIDELDVEQTHQGKGIGRRLLGHATDWAKAHELKRLSLTTFRSIPWNAPFYASFGFREWDPAEAPDTIRQALQHEGAKGLPDRCAMVMDL